LVGSPSSVYASRDGRVFLSHADLRYTDTLDGSWTTATYTGDDYPEEALGDAPDGRMIATGIGPRGSMLFDSIDRGQSWTPLVADVFTTATSNGAVTPQGVFVSAGSSLWRRAPDETEWIRFSTGTVTAGVDGTLFSGVWRYRPSQDQWVDQRKERAEIDDGLEVRLVTDQGVAFATALDTVAVSTDLGDSWSRVWGEGVDGFAANSAGIVAAVIEDKGVYVYRDDGWAHIGPGPRGAFDSAAVLPDGRVVALWNSPTASDTLVVTAAPVRATPYPSTPRPAACGDGQLSAGEEALDCGGDCVACPTWTLVPWAPQHAAQIATPQGTLLVWGTELFRSEDEGRSWQAVPLPDGHTTQAGVGQPSRAGVAADGTIYFLSRASAEPHLLVSEDQGRTFEVRGALPSTGNIVVAASGAVLIEHDDDYNRSTDGGLTFEPITVRGFPAGDLFALETGEIFVTHDLGIDRSRDDGDTWEEIEVPTTNTFIRPAGRGVLYANTGSGFHLSDDAGDTWLPVELPEPYDEASAFRVTRGGKYLYFGTGVFVSDTGTSGWRAVADRGRGGLPGQLLDDGRFVQSGGVLAYADPWHISTDPDGW
jgi:hypothetical protein